jgi:hypothetical protein
MLFNKRTKKVIQWVFGGLAVLMAVSMVLAYSGVGKIASTSSIQPQQQVGQTTQTDATAANASTPSQQTTGPANIPAPATTP